MSVTEIQDPPKGARGSFKREGTDTDIKQAASGEAYFATAFFDALVDRYPLLSRLMSALVDQGAHVGRSKTRDIDDVISDLLGPVASVLLALEFARLEQGSERIDVVDFCRLYEACVYKVSTSVFKHESDWPERIASELASAPRDGDVSRAAEHAEREVSNYYREADLADTGQERRLEVIRDYLRGAGRRTRLHLDLELFLYCVALLAKRSQGDPEVAAYALSDKHRFSFTGNPIAAFFKATGLIATPYTPTTYLRLGYELCTSALARFPHQPGAHHTAALYELRLANVFASDDGIHEWLERALASADRAIALDPEWPEFYATRALVRRRLHDAAAARIDYETAIQLVLSSPEYRPHLSHWIARWTAGIDQVADQQFT